LLKPTLYAGSDQRKVLIQRQKIAYIYSLPWRLSAQFLTPEWCSKAQSSLPRGNRLAGFNGSTVQRERTNRLARLFRRHAPFPFSQENYSRSQFARDRRRYLRWVFEAIKRFGLSVLDSCHLQPHPSSDQRHRSKRYCPKHAVDCRPRCPRIQPAKDAAGKFQQLSVVRPRAAPNCG
jgi:hypothetical protein